MSMLIKRFTELYLLLLDRRESIGGRSNVGSPPFKPSQRDILDQKIVEGGGQIQNDYQAAYIQPLREAIKSQDFWNRDKRFQTAVINAAIQPASGNDLKQDIMRIQAVIVDMYRSFCYSDRHSKLQLTSIPKLPPLVSLTAPTQTIPPTPFTVVLQEMKSLSRDFKVGTVSIPAGYRNHPILWGVLTHEVGGHTVLEAYGKLIPELKSKIHKLFHNDDILQRLWGHWCEEAASEVCAVLNLGPSYGHLSMLWFLFMTTPPHQQRRKLPKLSCKGHPAHADDEENPLGIFYRMFSGDTSLPLDRHPIHALIPYVIIGAVTALDSLSEKVRTRYLVQLTELAKTLVGSPKVIEFPSSIRVLPPLPKTVPFNKMQASALKFGSYVATVKLKALNNRTLQDLETWDDVDENYAKLVAQQLLNNRSLPNILAKDTPDVFEDARLLVGALFAALRNPQLYDPINEALSECLGISYSNDPSFNFNSTDIGSSKPLERRHPNGSVTLSI